MATEATDDEGACDTCGVGRFRMMTGLGRTFLYRQGIRVVVPEDVLIPTCDHCGQHIMDAELCRLITEIGRKTMGSR